MTAAERIMAVFTGEKPDRPPFALTLSLYGARLINAPLARYYADPALYAQGQVRVAELVSPDVIFGPFALALEAEAYGAELLYHSDGPPMVRRHPFRSPRDAASLSPPAIDTCPGLAYLRGSVRRLADHFCGSVPLAGVLTAPVDLPAMLMGLDGWLETLLFEPALAETVLAAATEHFAAMVGALAAAGAACIAIPLMLANPTLVTPAVISRSIVPPLARAFARTPIPIILHHGGNPAMPFLPLMKALPNVAGFVIGPGDSFAEARSIVGEEKLLLGNLNGPVLNRLTPEQAGARAAAILADRRDDPHFVLASSSADVPLDTPLETLLAVRAAVEGHGGGR
ncbi:uroporphyrinogen decarboxylase family protein [Geobacter grbiciae]|uniref:uroporphyrinogen decarboxylase family protein n=1 Tax=Geobacter grbiciae TaxID=155042 RepID=UPI001C011819|nr:uroporphyrinogen decarboxylase family protein [Geobacter grbiciae]MBT1076889.1 uroporphyrinogen decarboxylase family protein [Geobacter grbiciae]